MKLLISHMTALRYWRAATAMDLALAKPCNVTSVAGSVSSIKDLKRLAPADHGFIMSEDYPLEALVASTGARRYAQAFTPRVWNGGVPRGAFRRLTDDIYISSPEFVYLQLAASLDEIELARLALELCGVYGLAWGSGFRDRTVPLTTKAGLERFLQRTQKAYGLGKALHALRWVANGSASPQETNMVLALCLPQRWGGYGFWVPQLNPTIHVGARLETYVRRGEYRPDCLWVRTIKSKGRSKKVRITAEYDSKDKHNSQPDAERTRIRRNDFKTMGYLVTSVNASQMRDASEFEVPARQIARDLGLRRPAADIPTLTLRDGLLMKLMHDGAR